MTRDDAINRAIEAASSGRQGLSSEHTAAQARLALAWVEIAKMLQPDPPAAAGWGQGQAMRFSQTGKCGHGITAWLTGDHWLHLDLGLTECTDPPITEGGRGGD